MNTLCGDATCGNVVCDVLRLSPCTELTATYEAIFFVYVTSNVQYTTYKIIACIERATVLWSNIIDAPSRDMCGWSMHCACVV